MFLITSSFSIGLNATLIFISTLLLYPRCSFTHTSSGCVASSVHSFLFPSLLFYSLNGPRLNHVVLDILGFYVVHGVQIGSHLSLFYSFMHLTNDSLPSSRRPTLTPLFSLILPCTRAYTNPNFHPYYTDTQP
ncbi:hypothetical protein BJ165DRAFT_743603 [Panaeolus papilionaceus]|nr:hypothetical protein BJ165DRAFT_743603 [Panaeolus papilionaceus]